MCNFTCIMTDVPITFDFSHEDTSDFTGIIVLNSLLNKTPPRTPFQARVPEHLSASATEHWNYDPLLD
jgi:hypothetical protein